MKTESASLPEDVNEQIGTLVRTLQDAERRLQELTQGQVDAVVLPAGQAYLLGAAQEKLRNNEALLRSASKIAQMGGWTVDLPEYRISWSDEVCAIHDCPPGFKASLAEGMNFYTPEWRETIIQHFGACVRDGVPFDLEAELITAAGRRVWVRTIGEAVRDDAGVVVRVQGAFQDISKHKQAQLELARSNRALKILSQGNELLIRAKNEAGLLADICQVAVETGGYQMAWVGYAQTDAECSIKPMAYAGVEQDYFSEVKISWSESSPEGGGPAGRTIRSGQPVVCEDLTEDESFTPWRAAARQRGYKGIVCLPLRDEAKTFGLLSFFSSHANALDANELKLLQDLADDLAFGISHLRSENERRLADAKVREQAALLDAASDAIILRDIDDRVIFWNQGAEKIYGWTAAEMAGRKTRDLLFNDPAKFDEGWQVLLQKNHWRAEVRQHTKDWRTITVETRWTLLRDAAGQPKSILAINTDITEHKKLESQFLRIQRIESIGTLASGVAHDLNNMLAPITISIQLLRDKIKDDEGRRLLATLSASTQRGAELVKQVLAFARGVEGQRVPISPVHVLRDIQKIIRDTFPKNIEFTFESARDIWLVNGDPTQLHQVFMNLCVNARDAMPDGGKLAMTMENIVLDETYAGLNPESRAGAYVLIQVTDTGCGIPEAIRDQIFEPFFTTKELGKGTGLGLSTTLAIVKSHEGFINVYSEPGKGSVFKIYLPAKAGARAAEKVVVEKSQFPRGNGELLLVVDDEASIRLAASKMLERFGYRVLLAANGAEAVSLYARQGDDIALVVTDMAMPVMDGPSTIIALKVMNPKVKIIGSSGHASNGGVAKAVGAGIKHFIPKPYTAEAMLNLLAEVIRESA